MCEALGHAYERWDGKGYPEGLRGEDVPLAVRVVAVARDVEMCSRHRDWPATVELLDRRRDRTYDPEVVDALVADGEGWLAALGDDVCAVVLDAEPEPVLTIDRHHLDGALAAVADFTDLKSPFFRGHSPGVAELAAAAMGISPKMVGHHVAHLYAKAGFTTRAGVTLFAMEHGLLSP